ncbi:MAG TPA: ABC transporter permease [Solirubrobacteraceae bacterium]
MSVAGRGIRNVFRNRTRTVSIVLILRLAIGLAFVMLIAHRAVGKNASTALSSVGNTVTIGPPGYSAGGPLGKFLSTAELAPIARLHGVTGLDEYFNGAAKARDLPPRSATGTGSNAAKRLGAHHGSRAGPVKQGSTSLKYPGTLALATQGLACQPAPCTPLLPSYFTIYLSGSTEPTASVNIGASTLKIVSGHAISGTSSAYDAMISTEMARKNGLNVGSTFRAYGKSLTVAAIFQSDSQQGNDTVITSLPVLQRLERDTGLVFAAVVTASSLTELSKVTSEIDRTLGKRASVVSYVSDAQQAVSDLNGVKSIALDSLVGAVGAAVVILFFVMVMIVRERKREIGVLKALGAPNARIMAQFTTEAVTFTLLGLVLGFVIGIIAASPVTSSLVSHRGVSSETGARGLFGAGTPTLTELTEINAHVGLPVILEALAAAVLVAALASAAAAWMISRVRPAEVLRSA